LSIMKRAASCDFAGHARMDASTALAEDTSPPDIVSIARGVQAAMAQPPNRTSVNRLIEASRSFAML
jgi:hypothetical protein